MSRAENLKRKLLYRPKKKKKLKKKKKFPFQSYNELAYLDNVPYWKKPDKCFMLYDFIIYLSIEEMI